MAKRDGRLIITKSFMKAKSDSIQFSKSMSQNVFLTFGYVALRLFTISKVSRGNGKNHVCHSYEILAHLFTEVWNTHTQRNLLKLFQYRLVGTLAIEIYKPTCV